MPNTNKCDIQIAGFYWLIKVNLESFDKSVFFVRYLVPYYDLPDGVF